MAQYTHLTDLITLKLFSIQVQVNTCTTSRYWNSKIPSSGSTDTLQNLVSNLWHPFLERVSGD